MAHPRYEAYLGVHPILLKDGKDILHANEDTDEMWTLMCRIARLLQRDEIAQLEKSWLTCEWCGEKFAKPNGKGPTPKFCSDAHRQAAHRKRHGD